MIQLYLAPHLKDVILILSNDEEIIKGNFS